MTKFFNVTNIALCFCFLTSTAFALPQIQTISETEILIPVWHEHSVPVLSQSIVVPISGPYSSAQIVAKAWPGTEQNRQELPERIIQLTVNLLPNGPIFEVPPEILKMVRYPYLGHMYISSAPLEWRGKDDIYLTVSLPMADPKLLKTCDEDDLPRFELHIRSDPSIASEYSLEYRCQD